MPRLFQTSTRMLAIVMLLAFTGVDSANAQDKNGKADPAPATSPAAPDAKNKWAAKSNTRINKWLGAKDLSAVEVVLIGDSTFADWQKTNKASWKDVMSQQPYCSFNMGVGGDRTENVLYRIQPGSEGGLGYFDDDQLQPRTIVLMIGTNNLLTHDATETAAGITAVRDQLRELRSDAKIIVCSVLPTSKDKTNRDLVIPINEAIQSLEHVEWLDLYPLFTDEDGKQRKELFKDGSHPNKKGYQILEDQLLPLFN